MRLGLSCQVSGIGVSGLTLSDLSPVGQSVVRLNTLDHVVCPYLSPSPNIRHYMADESLQCRKSPPLGDVAVHRPDTF